MPDDYGRWNDVDNYINEHLISVDPVLDAVLEASEAADLPPINVSPNQGKLLSLLVGLVGAKRVLEIGTLAAYSAIWMARALPEGGSLITLEADPRHAEVAHANIERSGLGERIQIRVGPALDALALLAEEAGEPFGLVFIDADKRNNPEYFAWALKMTRVGGVIVIDNVVRNGAVMDASTTDPDIQGTRRLYEVMASEPRVSATAIQTVGVKGYDGLAIAVVVQH